MMTNAAETGVLVSPMRTQAHAADASIPGAVETSGGSETIAAVVMTLGGASRLTYVVREERGSVAAGTRIQVVVRAGGINRVIEDAVWPIGSTPLVMDGWSFPIVGETVTLNLIFPAAQDANAVVGAALFASSI